MGCDTYTLMGCNNSNGIFSLKAYEPFIEHGYYAPNIKKTINRNDEQCAVISYGNIKEKVVAISYEAKVVIAFDESGQVLWRIPGVGRNIVAHDGIVIFQDKSDRKFLIVNYKGDIISSVSFDERPYMHYFDGQYFAVGYKEKVKIYKVDTKQLISGFDLAKKTPVKIVDVHYARGMDIRGDQIIIASTFAHQVITTSFSGTLNKSKFEFFYPNDVVFINAHEVLVVEEHMNRVVKLNIVTGGWDTMLSPPYEVFKSYNYKQITAKQRAYSEDEGSRSKASDLHSGYNTLYAPNGIDKYKNQFAIADTDNNRIVFTNRKLDIKGVISGVNNVSNVQFLK